MVRRRDYTIYLESFSGRTWGHVDFHKTSRGALQHFTQDAKMLVALQGAPLLVIHRPDDKKHAKFLRLTGAVHLLDSVDINGDPFQVFEYN